MGNGIVCKCKSCGKEHSFCFGGGFMFPKVYAETYMKMKLGKYGSLGKKFLTEHPEGAVNCEEAALYCGKCHLLKRGQDLTMYLPKDGYIEKSHEADWSTAMGFNGANYVTAWELKENYVEYAKYPHQCPRCKETMEVMNEEAFEEKLRQGELQCQKCGGKLAYDGWLNWD